MDDQTKPLQEEKKEEKIVEPTKEEGKPIVGSCPACNGEGLVLNVNKVHERCSQCGGTGKVN